MTPAIKSGQTARDRSGEPPGAALHGTSSPALPPYGAACARCERGAQINIAQGRRSAPASTRPASDAPHRPANCGSRQPLRDGGLVLAPGPRELMPHVEAHRRGSGLSGLSRSRNTVMHASPLAPRPCPSCLRIAEPPSLRCSCRGVRNCWRPPRGLREQWRIFRLAHPYGKPSAPSHPPNHFPRDWQGVAAPAASTRKLGRDTVRSCRGE